MIRALSDIAAGDVVTVRQRGGGDHRGTVAKVTETQFTVDLAPPPAGRASLPDPAFLAGHAAERGLVHGRPVCRSASRLDGRG